MIRTGSASDRDPAGRGQPGRRCASRSEALKEGKVYNNLHWAKDGVEALEFLRRQGKYADAPRPDIILLDLNLPKKDGREVLQEIKNDDRAQAHPGRGAHHLEGRGGRAAQLQPARQLLRHQAGRPREVHRGGEVDRRFWLTCRHAAPRA